MISFNKSKLVHKDELLAGIDDVLSSGILTNNGPMVKRLEGALCDYFNIPFGLSLSNGTTALQVAIRSLGVKGEIITSPFSFVASSSAILYEGCTPVFADIDPHQWTMQPDNIRALINERTVAILPIHIFGNSCEIDKIQEIAEEFDLPVIYDGAHAFGSTFKDRSIFSYGSLSCLSMHAYKIFSSIEGGMLFSHSERLNHEIFKIRYFGKEMDNSEVMVGTNAKMSEINAVFALTSLKHVEKELIARKRIANYYFEQLKHDTRFTLMEKQKDTNLNNAYFPVLFPKGTDIPVVVRKAKNKGVELRRYFYPSLSSLDFMPRKSNTPMADDIANRVVCLPIHGDMSSADAKTVVRVIIACL